jgi:hypothetical protein
MNGPDARIQDGYGFPSPGIARAPKNVGAQTGRADGQVRRVGFVQADFGDIRVRSQLPNRRGRNAGGHRVDRLEAADAARAGADQRPLDGILAGADLPSDLLEGFCSGLPPLGFKLAAGLR